MKEKEIQQKKVEKRLDSSVRIGNFWFNLKLFSMYQKLVFTSFSEQKVILFGPFD